MASRCGRFFPSERCPMVALQLKTLQMRWCFSFAMEWFCPCVFVQYLFCVWVCVCVCNSQVLGGRRLERPDDCPMIMFLLMKKCWDKSRPGFSSIHNFLKQVFAKQDLDTMDGERVHPDVRLSGMGALAAFTRTLGPSNNSQKKKLDEVEEWKGKSTSDDVIISIRNEANEQGQRGQAVNIPEASHQHTSHISQDKGAEERMVDALRAQNQSLSPTSSTSTLKMDDTAEATDKLLHLLTSNGKKKNNSKGESEIGIATHEYHNGNAEDITIVPMRLSTSIDGDDDSDDEVYALHEDMASSEAALVLSGDNSVNFDYVRPSIRQRDSSFV
eukprot:m.157537 g.157537  ORF g.157537 m.157537 type:complete len:329 (+) comp13350_c0_seq4:2787-3773(+)